MGPILEPLILQIESPRRMSPKKSFCPQSFCQKQQSPSNHFALSPHCPNGLPDLTPGTTFDVTDADLACDSASAIFEEATQAVARGEPGEG